MQSNGPLAQVFAVLKLLTIHVLYVKIHACIQKPWPGPSQASQARTSLTTNEIKWEIKQMFDYHVYA